MLTETELKFMVKTYEQIGKNKAYSAILEKVIDCLKTYPHPMARVAITEIGDYICFLKDNDAE